MEAHFKKAAKSSLMLKSASTKRKKSVHQQAEESALQQQVLLTPWLYPSFAATSSVNALAVSSFPSIGAEMVGKRSFVCISLVEAMLKLQLK